MRGVRLEGREAAARVGWMSQSPDRTDRTHRKPSVLPRRLLTIPGILGLACVAWASAPLWLPVLFCVDLFRRRRFATLRMGAFALVYLACETLGISAAFGAWLRKLGLRQDEEAWQETNYRLQAWWGSTLFGAAQRIYGLSVSVEHEGSLSHGPLILLLRHASLADTLLGVLLFSAPHGLRFRYVLKRELLVDPCLDIVGNRVPNAFVRRDGADSAREIEAVSRLGEGLGVRDGVLIYPEGTRFTEAKRRRVIERLKEKGDTELAVRAEGLRHVLPPRPGGALALLAAAPDADVVLCAHHGFEAAGTVRDLWSGRLIGQRLEVRCVRYDAREVPREPRLASAWLLERWEEVDAFVARRSAS